MRAPGIVIAAIAAASARAAAAPGDDPAVGHAVFTGAASPDPTSLVGNPAALDLGREGFHVWLGGLATIDQYAITLDQADATGALTPGPPVNATTSSWGGQLALYEVKPEFAAGLFADLPPADVQPADRDALRYHTLGGQLREKTYFALAGSIRLADGLYVGGSAAYVQTVIDLAFARDTALEAGPAGVASDCGGQPCGLENPAADEIYHIHAYRSPRGFNRIAFTLGLAWRISERVAIGAFYREPQGFNGAVTDQGTVDVTRAPRDGGSGTGGIAAVSYIPAQAFELGGKVTIADGLAAIAGARWELTSRTQELDLRMFGEGLAGIPEWYPRARGFRDTFAGWAGVEQADDGRSLVLGARLGLSNGAVSPDKLSPMQVDGTSVTADVGVQWRIATSIALVAGYGAQWYLPEDVTTSAYDPTARLGCVASDYDLSTPACQAVAGGYGIDTAAGHYGRWEHVVRVGLRFDLE
jgi:hypothetical protein